jgi:hypothetical protein
MQDEEIAELSRSLERLKVQTGDSEDDHKRQIKVLSEEHDMQVQALKTELRKITSEYEQLLPLKEQVAELSQSSQFAREAKKSIAELEADNHKLRGELLTLQQHVSQSTRQLEHATGTNSKLQLQLERLKEQLEREKGVRGHLPLPLSGCCCSRC